MRDVAPELLQTRIRNRVIECLEIFVSPEETARLGWFSTVNLWGDFVDEYPDQDFFAPPVFSTSEVSALLEFNTVLVHKADAFDKDVFDAETLRKNKDWSKVTASAMSTLQIFMVRGRFSEEKG